MTNISRMRVRYAETDQMGVVYYANFLVWMEIGRTELLRSSGVSYLELEREGFFLPVSKVFAKYISPAGYDDMIAVYSTFTRLTPSRVRIDYRIFREEEGKESVLLCTGFTEHAFLSASTRKVVQVPENVASRIRIPANVEDFVTRV